FCGHSRSGFRPAVGNRGEYVMATVRLLLLDDHTLFRAMLSKLLATESDFRVLADCSANQEALEALDRNRVDLVLLDYDLGDRQNGFQFIRKAREAGYGGRIFIVTAGMNDAD